MYRRCLLLAAAACAAASPLAASQEAQRRDGAHHSALSSGSYSGSAASSFSAPAKPVVKPVASAPVSNHLDAPSYVSAPPKQQVGYYYYYYPIQVKQEDKSFYAKMKKFFEPIWYPWDTMKYYLGYGDDQYDYDYDSYGYYRSVSDSVSDYVPWSAIEEVGNVVTQDRCIEFYMCQLGSYARDSDYARYLAQLVLPHISSNSYYSSMTESALSEKDCFEWSCPVVRRVSANEL